MSAAWTSHPAIEQVPERYRAELLEMVCTTLKSPEIAAHCGVPVAVVTTLRAAKKRDRVIARRQREGERRREGRPPQPRKPPTQWQPASKPCGCGRPGCMAIRRAGEDMCNWTRRKYASHACGGWVQLSKLAERAGKRLPAEPEEPLSSRYAPVAEDAAEEAAGIDFLDALLDAHGPRWPADDDVGEFVLGQRVLVRTEMGRMGVMP